MNIGRPFAISGSSVLRRYAVAGLSVACITAIRLAMNPLMGRNSSLVLFTLAVMLASGYGGKGSGLTATALSALVAWYFFIDPRRCFAMKEAGGILNVALFVVAGAGISLLSERLRKALTASEQNEESYRQMIESACQAIVGVGADGRITIVNAMAERTFDYVREELFGQPIDVLVPERHRGQQLPHGAASFGPIPACWIQSAGGDSSARRKDGTEFPVEVHPSVAQTGRGPLYLSLITDIGERKHAQQALAESAEQLRLFVEHAPAAVAMFDRNMRYIVVSRRWITDFRLGERDIIGKSHYEVFPEISPQVKEIHQRCLAGAVESCDDDLFPRSDGTVDWLQWEVRPWRKGDGEIGGIIIFCELISDRKLTEDALRESEERFRSLVENSTFGIYRTSPDGRTLMANPALLKMLGFQTFEELARRNLEKEGFALGYSRRDFRERLEETGSIRGLESAWARADGTVIFVRESAHVVRDESGKALYYDGVVEDITEQKRVEEALAKSESRFRRLAETNTIAIFVGDANGQILEANAAFLQMTGYNEEDLENGIIHWDKLAPPELRFIDARIQGQLATTGFSVPVETVHLRKDGRRLPVLLGMATLEGTQPRQAIGYMLDLTELKRVSEALRESENRYHHLFESAGDAILLSKGDTFVDANPKALALFRCSREQLIGHTPLDFSPHLQPDGSESRTVVTEHVRRALSGETAHFEWQHMRTDGTPFDVEITLSSVEISGEIHLLGLIKDVTDRKKAEEERRRLEAQLVQAQKMESVGRLAGGVAHDFNNHLTVINGYCSLLLGELKHEDPARGRITEILHAGEQAARVTQQLLAFSRKQVLDPKPLDLNILIAETEKMLSRLIGEDIALVTKPDPRGSFIHADAGQINQVLMNLAVNARDAMPSGGKILIQTSIEDVNEDFSAEHDGIAPGRYVLLTFSDTGHGMDQDTQRRIFEPFFTTKQPGKGTGLGLAMVYGIVKQSGGSIWVYSEPDKGTTFKLYFPRIGRVPGPADTAETPADLRGNETLLVVEDQDDVRRLAVSILRSYGYQVLEAANGQEAIRQSENHPGPIELLITDVVMQGITGRQVAERLRATRPDIKVLYTSGHPADVIAHQGILEPGIAFLPKPFTDDTLATKVRTVLGRRKGVTTILVADDDDAVRGLICHILASAGYAVLEAPNGRVALETIRSRDVDLLITDLAMPEQEGLETMMALKRVNPGFKIIAISGAFGSGMLRSAEKLGASASLRKPIPPKELLEVVRQVLRG